MLAPRPTLTPLNAPPPLRRKRERGLEVCHYLYQDSQGKPLLGGNGAPLVDVKGRSLKGVGRIFRLPLDGEPATVDLFPIGVLAAILNRTYRCIYKWEKEHGFPQSLYLIEDDGQKKRWYSRAQLVATRKLYEHYGCLKGRGNEKKLKEFIQSLLSIWYVIDRNTTKGT